MIRNRFVAIAIAMLTLLSGCGESSPANPGEPMTADDFRRELVGLPLCGTPKDGPYSGKQICTVHLADGSAIFAGAGMLARGIWEVEGSRICRRDAAEPAVRRRCVVYVRLGGNRYRNSDNVEFCIGPCP